MKRYKCHKIVEAGKIAKITGKRLCEVTLEDGMVLVMNGEWRDHHDPKVGGYYVRYSDGYASYSQAQAFEEGYIEIDY